MYYVLLYFVCLMSFYLGTLHLPNKQLLLFIGDNLPTAALSYFSLGAAAVQVCVLFTV